MAAGTPQRRRGARRFTACQNESPSNLQPKCVSSFCRNSLGEFFLGFEGAHPGAELAAFSVAPAFLFDIAVPALAADKSRSIGDRLRPRRTNEARARAVSPIRDWLHLAAGSDDIYAATGAIPTEKWDCEVPRSTATPPPQPP